MNAQHCHPVNAAHDQRCRGIQVPQAASTGHARVNQLSARMNTIREKSIDPKALKNPVAGMSRCRCSSPPSCGGARTNWLRKSRLGRQQAGGARHAGGWCWNNSTHRCTLCMGSTAKPNKSKADADTHAATTQKHQVTEDTWGTSDKSLQAEYTAQGLQLCRAPATSE